MHLALDGEGPHPVALQLANLMERFPGRFITEIEAELERLDGVNYPADLLWNVFEAGDYRDAKRATDAATTAEARKALPKGGLWSLVNEIEFGLKKAGSSE